MLKKEEEEEEGGRVHIVLTHFCVNISESSDSLIDLPDAVFHLR